MRTHLKETENSWFWFWETQRLHSCLLFPPYFPQQSFLSVQEENEWRKKKNTKEELMTFVVKLHVQWNLDGWTERKEEEICPAKEWSSSIQRMPANFTVITQKLFLVWSTGGFQCWASRVLLVFCSFRLLWKPAGPGPGLETTAVNTFWFSLNSVPGFPQLPSYNLTICCLCWGPVTLASQTCQYNHRMSVCTLDMAENVFKYSNHSRCDWLSQNVA